MALLPIASASMASFPHRCSLPTYSLPLGHAGHISSNSATFTTDLNTAAACGLSLLPAVTLSYYLFRLDFTCLPASSWGTTTSGMDCRETSLTPTCLPHRDYHTLPPATTTTHSWDHWDCLRHTCCCTCLHHLLTASLTAFSLSWDSAYLPAVA